MTLRFILAFVFIFSGVEKISDPASFSDAITNYKLFPLFTVNFIAVFVPWLELFVGALLLFGIWIKENALIVNALFGFFILIIAVALARGLDINCGCFGTRFAQKVGLEKIAENILLMIASYILFKFSGKNEIEE